MPKQTFFLSPSIHPFSLPLSPTLPSIARHAADELRESVSAGSQGGEKKKERRHQKEFIQRVSFFFFFLFFIQKHGAKSSAPREFSVGLEGRLFGSAFKGWEGHGVLISCIIFSSEQPGLGVHGGASSLTSSSKHFYCTQEASSCGRCWCLKLKCFDERDSPASSPYRDVSKLTKGRGGWARCSQHECSRCMGYEEGRWQKFSLCLWFKARCKVFSLLAVN